MANEGKIEDPRILPNLGEDDGGGGVWDIRRLMTLAVGAASVLFKSDDGMTLNGVFDTERASKIVDEIMANVCAYADEQIRQHNKVQEEKRLLTLAQKDWYDAPDAMVWAEKFVEMVQKDSEISIDAGLMVSWFANAMAAAIRNMPSEGWDVPRLLTDIHNLRHQREIDNDYIGRLNKQLAAQATAIERQLEITQNARDAIERGTPCPVCSPVGHPRTRLATDMECQLCLKQFT
jgi:hypothetical protein